MAVDFGNLNSGLRGSAGNTTWRRVRGRTIQSQKRGKNTDSFYATRAAAGLVRTYREALFFIMSSFADGMQNSINESFALTKYGSRRNNFFRANYSAVEKALNGSELGLALLDQVMHNVSFTGVYDTISEKQYAVEAFDTDGWDALMNAAAASGVSGVYIRSNIGGQEVTTFQDKWGDSSDPSTASVTGFVLNVTTGPIGQRIAGITLQGTNLPATITYSVRVGSPNAPVLNGSWTGSKFVPSGQDAATEYTNTHTIYITKGSRVLFSRDVSFYASGAGGE